MKYGVSEVKGNLDRVQETNPSGYHVTELKELTHSGYLVAVAKAISTPLHSTAMTMEHFYRSTTVSVRAMAQCHEMAPLR